MSASESRTLRCDALGVGAVTFFVVSAAGPLVTMAGGGASFVRFFPLLLLLVTVIGLIAVEKRRRGDHEGYRSLGRVTS